MFCNRDSAKTSMKRMKNGNHYFSVDNENIVAKASFLNKSSVQSQINITKVRNAQSTLHLQPTYDLLTTKNAADLQQPLALFRVIYILFL